VKFFQIQHRGDVRCFDRRRRFCGCGGRLLHLFFSGSFIPCPEMLPDFVCQVVIECAGVRFLVLDPYFS
jgi:hypothetical protein